MEPIRVLVYTDNKLGIFVAQCLEHDICVQAKTVPQVRRLLAAQFEFYVSEYGDMSKVPPAPDFFVGEWETTDGDPERLHVGATDADFKILAKTTPAMSDC